MPNTVADLRKWPGEAMFQKFVSLGLKFDNASKVTKLLGTARSMRVWQGTQAQFSYKIGGAQKNYAPFDLNQDLLEVFS